VSEINYERELGAVGQRLNAIDATLLRMESSMNTFHDATRGQLGKLETQGCAAGVQRGRDIQDLKDRPARNMALAGGVATLVSAVIAWIWHGK